jgi:hypothetical protein
MGAVSNLEHKERYIIALLIIVAVAVIIWWGPTLQFNGMRLYFPDKSGRALKLEKRPIAPIGNFEEKAKDTVEELLLGPLSRNLQPIAHVDISLERIVSDSNTLYLDFTTEDLPGLSSEYKMFKDAVTKSLHDTIPGNFHIYLYINGTLAR